jgi:hypothetical protein
LFLKRNKSQKRNHATSPAPGVKKRGRRKGTKVREGEEFSSKVAGKFEWESGRMKKGSGRPNSIERTAAAAAAAQQNGRQK